jgi:hypothetical protein
MRFIEEHQTQILHDDGHWPVIEKHEWKLHDELARSGERGVTARCTNMQLSSPPIHPPETEYGEAESQDAKGKRCVVHGFSLCWANAMLSRAPAKRARRMEPLVGELAEFI